MCKVITVKTNRNECLKSTSYYRTYLAVLINIRKKKRADLILPNLMKDLKHLLMNMLIKPMRKLEPGTCSKQKKNYQLQTVHYFSSNI